MGTLGYERIKELFCLTLYSTKYNNYSDLVSLFFFRFRVDDKMGQIYVNAFEV